METKEFKCKDEVIYKVESENALWTYGIFSHYIHYEDGTSSAVIDGRTLDLIMYQILPYEGNEHLVGTDLPADEEVKLEEGEWIMCAAGPYNYASDWALRQFDQTREKAFLVVNGGLSSFAIRFKDFDPSNMEETKKHILCVKNGKIVRYRE